MQLQEVADALDGDARVVAIGTDTPEEARELARQLGLHLPLLSDPTASVAASLGIAHDEPFGHGRVPYPTTLVLDAEGRIVWAHRGEGVIDRPTKSELLAAVAGARL